MVLFLEGEITLHKTITHESRGSRGMCGMWEVEDVFEELCNQNDQEVVGY